MRPRDAIMPREYVRYINNKRYVFKFIETCSLRSSDLGGPPLAADYQVC